MKRFAVAALPAVLMSCSLLHAQQPSPSLIGWRVAVSAASFRADPLFDAIDKSAAMGIRSLEGYAGQKISSTIAKNLDWQQLEESEIAEVRRQLRAKNVAMPAYYTRNIPADEAGARKLFQFAKALGVETIVGEPDAKTLEAIDKFANEAGINVAIHNHTRKSSPVYWDPKNVMSALEGRSKRMGVCADTGAWMRESIRFTDGLQVVKDRLLCLHIHDVHQAGPEGRDVPLGKGVAGIPEFARELHRAGVKPLILTIEYSARSQAAAAEIGQSYQFLMSRAVAPIIGELMEETARKSPTRWQVSPADREKIAAAVPQKAPAKPQKPRKLLVIDLNAAYGGHRSIPYFNVALDLMAKSTGAFEPVFSNDLANLRWDKLKQFDAVYLNNTVGPIINPPELRESLLRFVREGGGLGGHHGTCRASLDWPEFAEMLGSYCGPHGDGNEKVSVKLDDPNSPVNAVFGGKPFEFTDEYFRFPSPPYSRDKLHVLLSFDVAKTDMNQGRGCVNCAREDNDYAISWIRSYGKGRVFYASFGNAPSVYMVPQILEHFLAGIQFALGDLKADTTPSARLSSKR